MFIATIEDKSGDELTRSLWLQSHRKHFKEETEDDDDKPLAMRKKIKTEPKEKKRKKKDDDEDEDFKPVSEQNHDSYNLLIYLYFLFVSIQLLLFWVDVSHH